MSHLRYGFLATGMSELIAHCVKGQDVWDLGAGSDLAHTKNMLKLGARSVTAVEKAELYDDTVIPRGATLIRSYSNSVQLPETGIDVAFLAFPQNTNLPGLVSILEQSRIIIYLGSNTDATACGNMNLYLHFLQRDVLATIPNRRNSLIVYGARSDIHAKPRRPLPEEWAGLHPDEMFSFEEAVAAVLRR